MSSFSEQYLNFLDFKRRLFEFYSRFTKENDVIYGERLASFQREITDLYREFDNEIFENYPPAPVENDEDFRLLLNEKSCHHASKEQDEKFIEACSKIFEKKEN